MIYVLITWCYFETADSAQLKKALDGRQTPHDRLAVVSCPDPTQPSHKERVWCHKPESLGLRKC